MTVTITTKREIAADANDNETCCSAENCGIHDHTSSLLEDLPQPEEEAKKEIHDDIYYEKARTLLHYEDAPAYMKHNPFILTGYRGILNTELCIESIFWWTNETINIWSHIYGLILFVALTIKDFLIIKMQANWGDKVMAVLFLACFVCCMGLSALYHTFSCRSEEDCHRFLKYDLLGIALSLLAIYTSGVYYAFWCDTVLQIFYLATVTLIFVIAMILQMPRFKVNDHVKMIVFVGWAAYGVIPTIHWSFKMGGLDNPLVEMFVPRILIMYALSGGAFLIYLTKIPERFSAGRFDFIGHSHQWWHFFVVMALYYWHNCGIIYIEYRMNHACPNKMSIFWWTNETINIWSHISGLVLFLVLTVNDFFILRIQATWGDKVIVGMFLACFVSCMALSALYHTFSCRSEQDCHRFLTYDLLGIALSLLAIYTSGIYYAFWCETELRTFYLASVTIIFIFAMVLQLPKLNINAHVKMLVFVAWAGYGVIPTLHWTIKMGGLNNPVVELLLPRVLGMYAISGTAFFIYITKIPERFLAGKFDFIGHSHQWWHFFVVMALYYWHNSGMVYVEYRMNHACPNNMKFL